MLSGIIVKFVWIVVEILLIDIIDYILIIV